jgi:hypothetical protein
MALIGQKQATPAQAPTSVASTGQQTLDPKAIAEAAYYRWISRGRPQGSDKADWVAAEQELRAKMQAKRA